jgi:uncharacterized protein YciI
MLFAVHCKDKPESEIIRSKNRSAHLAWLESYGTAIIAAGPTLNEDGTLPTGSLIILDLPDRAAVDSFCIGDPYAKASLFERVDVTRWKQVFPKN